MWIAAESCVYSHASMHDGVRGDWWVIGYLPSEVSSKYKHVERFKPYEYRDGDPIMPMDLSPAIECWHQALVEMAAWARSVMNRNGEK